MNLMLCAMLLNERSSLRGSRAHVCARHLLPRLGNPAFPALQGGHHQRRLPQGTGVSSRAAFRAPSQFALEHGPRSPAVVRQADHLKRGICRTAGQARPQNRRRHRGCYLARARARALAQAELDLARVRRAKVASIERASAVGELDPPQRMSCRTFAANALRLQLHALAYYLGNFLRTVATLEPIKDWSLTSLKDKLIKIGTKVVRHSVPPSTPRIRASGQSRKSLPSTPVSGFIRAISVEKDNPCRIRSKSGRDQRWDTGLLAIDATK
jgi:Transposase DDE domain group 1